MLGIIKVGEGLSINLNDGTLSTEVGRKDYVTDNSTDFPGEIFNDYGQNEAATLAHAEGCKCKALGSYSHAEGFYTVANNEYEHAEGRGNVSNTGNSSAKTTVHSVGIMGTTTASERHNAHEIMFNGDHYIYGLGGYDGTNALSSDSKTLQQVITELQSGQSYQLSIASADTLGGIKVGAGLSITANGILSATGGGVADSVA